MSTESTARRSIYGKALADVVGHNDGTFISCIPGRLAYFEGEGLNERHVLQGSG